MKKNLLKSAVQCYLCGQPAHTIGWIVKLCYDFTKMFVRKWTWKRADGGTPTYLGIARTYYQGGKVYQQRLCYMGNLDQLLEKGEIDIVSKH